VTSPTKGTQFRPGETVTIEVRTNKHYERVAIIAADPLVGMQMLKAEPYRFSLPLPPDLNAGLYTVTVIGGTLESSAEPDEASVEIDVEPAWSSSADASGLVHDAPGVSVDTGGIPLRHRSAVSYPSDLLGRGIEGAVVVEVRPDWEGVVEGVRVLSGPVELAKHVIQSVKTWHYAERVGKTKYRRVTVIFSISEAHRTNSEGVEKGPRLASNLTDGFWTSRDYRFRRFTLKRLVVFGLSEDETRKLMKRHEERGYREGEVLSYDEVQLLNGCARMFDHCLRTYLWLEGGDVAATVAPVGFTLGNSEESPPIETERVPPGEDPGRIRVAAVEQAVKLISKAAPEFPPVAKYNFIQGIVRVHIIIGKDGRVFSATPSGPVMLHEAAEKAVMQWTYAPTVVNGYPVEVITEADLEFFLPY
jgi:outer membrane biosynthesis protein TonB